MNYLDIITDISKITLGRTPANFAETSNKSYIRILEAIDNAIEDFFYSRQHNFRRRLSSFPIVAGQNAYLDTFGLIIEGGMLIDDGRKTVKIQYDIEQNLDLYPNTGETTEKPMYYTIYQDSIFFRPIPDAGYTARVMYDTDKPMKALYTITTNSPMGQPTLYMTNTIGLTVGDYLILSPNAGFFEGNHILSIVPNVSITLTSNLNTNYLVGNQISKPKNTFDYETDQPNFPEKHHKAIIYHALRQLFMADQAKYAKYAALYEDRLTQTRLEDRKTLDNKPKFIVNGIHINNAFSEY